MLFKKLSKFFYFDYFNYSDEIKEYTLIAQKILSISLFSFFSLYTFIVNLLEYTTYQQLNPTINISIIENIIFLLMFFIFKNYFSKNKKYILHAAYFNVFQTIALLELQYFLYREYVSYTIIICIIMITSVTVMGHIKYYSSIVLFIFGIDSLTLIFTNDGETLFYIATCIIDNLFIIFFTIGVHFYFLKIKIRDFKLKNELIILSETDPLTGLLNRKSAENYVNKYSKLKNLYSMIIIDIDNFKTVNDTLGHIKGDEVLKEIALNLKNIFQNNKCVSRLGGDEFMVFIPEIQNKEYVLKKSNEILNIFPLNSLKNYNNINVSCSVGIAFSNEIDSELYKDLYKKADIAMYKAKKSGKNQIFEYQNY